MWGKACHIFVLSLSLQVNKKLALLKLWDIGFFAKVSNHYSFSHFFVFFSNMHINFKWKLSIHNVAQIKHCHSISEGPWVNLQGFQGLSLFLIFQYYVKCRQTACILNVGCGPSHALFSYSIYNIQVIHSSDLIRSTFYNFYGAIQSQYCKKLVWEFTVDKKASLYLDVNKGLFHAHNLDTHWAHL